LIPNIVEDRDVRIANGFMYTTQYVAMIIGLATSGGIMRAFDAVIRFLIALNLGAFSQFIDSLSPVLLGSRAGYFVDSFTFILSALMIFAMHKSAEKGLPRADGALDLRSIGRDAVDSFRFLGQHADLRGLLISAGIAIIGGGAIVPVGLNHIATLEGIIPFANQIAWLDNFSASRQIFILTWMGIGMAIGAILVPKLEKRYSSGTLFPRTIASFAVGMFLFALNRSYFLACLMAVAGGFCISMLSVTGNNYIVQNVANDLRGRVFTALESVIRISLLISMIVTAPVSDFIGAIVLRIAARLGITTILGSPLTGPRITLILAGCIVAGAAVYCFRNMRDSDGVGGDRNGGVDEGGSVGDDRNGGVGEGEGGSVDVGDGTGGSAGADTGDGAGDGASVVASAVATGSVAAAPEGGVEAATPDSAT
ncbi:MAG: hypothetical protein LBJ07_00605, partial [Actinomycetes bacterium]|nr:hypothetical protein [Actinomycetes bacterium]